MVSGPMPENVVMCMQADLPDDVCERVNFPPLRFYGISNR